MSLDMNLCECVPAPKLETGIGTVFKKSVGTYFVQKDGHHITCAISNKLRKELVFPIADPTSFRRRVMAVEDIGVADPVAVGDDVRFTVAGDGAGLITEVLPRKSKLARRAAGAKPLEQVIVANADQVVIVFAAAHPAPKWNLLDRYLVSAEASQLPALICVTKYDLVGGDGDANGARTCSECLTDDESSELIEALETYRRIGYHLVLTSTITGAGLAGFAEELKDRTSVFVGKSGVGKTSLLNAIEPGLGLRVNEVSQSTDKGKHTTSHLEMFPLRMGGRVVDTPGMREFGLWDIGKTDIALFFPEMRPLVGRCQFGLDCGHTSEPGCAIKHAVQHGQVSERRYQSLLKMAGG